MPFFLVIRSPFLNVPASQHGEGAVDEPDLKTVDSSLQEDSTVHNAVYRDGQEGKVEDGESCGHLEVEVHQHVPILDTQNSKEGSDIHIQDEQTQLHDNIEDTNANGLGYVVSQPPTAADKSQPNHVASNTTLATFFI